jgi:23S rRNA pseudouridine2605 synthase
MIADSDQPKSGERIAKAIARAGLASRRQAEAWIAAGRIAVNGEVIRSPARNVGAADRITVDGEPLPARERTRLFLYHKPRGLITTHADPQGRPTIFQALPRDLPRLISVGRLDFNTEGLLLLTNDGALARVLELPSTGWLRRYRVRAHGAVTQPQLDGLRDGVTISGIHYGAIDATLERVQGSNLWLTFAIREGKNREVRNVLGHLGLSVTRLIRISFGPFQLGDLEVGALDEVRTRTLREQLGDKLIAQAQVDFSSPPPPSRPQREQERQAPAARPRGAERNIEPKTQLKAQLKTRFKTPPKPAPKPAPKPPHHVWRKEDDAGAPRKPLRRKFHGDGSKGGKSRGGKFSGSESHGGRRDAAEGRAGDKRGATITDRKGRTVQIERHGQQPVAEPPREAAREEAFRRGRKGGGRRRSPDRGSGPRPRHPRARG